MRVLVAIAALLTAAPSIPQDIASGPGTHIFAGMPPARFQGPAIVKLVVVPKNRLEEVCEVEKGDRLELLGCARSDWLGRPYIVIPDPCPVGDFELTARILCHELAHASGGWPGNHPE